MAAATLLGLAIGLGGCSIKGAQDDDQLDDWVGSQEPAYRYGNENGIEFPPLERMQSNGGFFVAPDRVLAIREQMSKGQVRQVLGDPHFLEGFFGVRKWNYVFNFDTGVGDEFITCQYQIHFDEEMRLADTFWRDGQCPSLLFPVESAPVDDQPELQKYMVSGTILFPFDSDVLSLEGKRAVERLTRMARDTFDAPVFDVSGYTDRLGDDMYNVQLSWRRSDAVRRYLNDLGVQTSDIAIDARGRENPTTRNCQSAGTREDIIRCLEPDRRVEVIVSEASS